jgi:hypothetical protein
MQSAVEQCPTSLCYCSGVTAATTIGWAGGNTVTAVNLDLGAIILSAQARKLQPPDGGQAAIPSLQSDSASVAPFLAFAANARQCPLKVARQRRCKQAQSLQSTARASTAANIF